MEGSLKTKISILVSSVLSLAAIAVLVDAYLHPKITTIEKERVIVKEVLPEMSLEMFLPRNRETITLRPDEKVKLIWSKWDEETSYLLSIVDNSGVSRDFDLRNNELEVDELKGESFSWTLTSISKRFGTKKAQGTFYISRKDLKRIPASEPVLEEVKVEAKFKVLEKNIKLKYPEKSLTLEWSGEAGRPYHFVMANQKNKIVADEEIQGQKRKINFSRAGVYKVSLFDGKKEVDSLTIHYDKKVASFHPTQPLNISGNELQLNYKIHTGDTVRLKTFNKKNVEKIARYTVHGSSQKLILKHAGQYCFVLENPQDNREEDASEPLCIDFSPGGQRGIASLPPSTTSAFGKKILNYYRIDGRDTYQFDLPEVKGATHYQVRLFKDHEAKELLKEATFKDRRVFWRTQREEKTFIQYRAMNSKGELLSWSETGELIFPISPFESN